MLNEEAEIVVDTPARRTKEFKVREIVKQETVWGPQTCCVNSEKVNDMREKTGNVLSPSVCTEALAHVDDILGAGSKKHVESIGKNLREMESI